jgi:hypothetical protein
MSPPTRAPPNVPTYQTLLTPTLETLASTGSMARRELRLRLATRFKLSPADLAVRQPSGKSGVFENRLNWAIHELRKAELINIGSGGSASITSRGKNQLRSGEELRVSSLRRANRSRYKRLSEFRSAILMEVYKRSTVHRGSKPGIHPRIYAATGISGYSFEYTLLKHRTRVELVIDGGAGRRESNKARLQELHRRRTVIESDLGRNLDWEQPPEPTRMPRRADG